MADILIRIEKPKNCFLCRFFREVQDYDGTFFCCLAAKKEINLDFDDCFFPSLPEGHGRLIDADALMNNIGDVPYKGSVRRVLMSAPTIVPAEGGADNG